MDIATIIGWVAGVAIVLQATSGEWAGLYNGTAVLVVVGGGLAATLVAFAQREALGALGAVKNVLMVRPPESADMVERIVGYAEKARREGILSLEKPMADEPNMLTLAGIGLVVDGTEPDLIMDILETELHHVAERGCGGCGSAASVRGAALRADRWGFRPQAGRASRAGGSGVEAGDRRGDGDTGG